MDRRTAPEHRPGAGVGMPSEFTEPAERRARAPFEFVTASYLIRIRPERARTLGELARHLRSCSEASIFYHTFQSLESHHYSAFSSDFAQWVMAACNEAELAERLGSIDLREVVSLSALRAMLVGAVESHLGANPAAADRPGFEPFHFCEALEMAVPIGERAWTLGELAAGIRRMSRHTLHHHFINSRLRLHLVTNDFSFWIEHNLDAPELARRIDHIDFYSTTLDGVRQEILRLLGRPDPR